MPKITPLPVSDADLANLRESGLTDQTILENGWYTEPEPKQIARLLKREWRSPGGALVIPYRGLDGELTDFNRLRPHSPRTDEKGKLVKYESPCRSSPPRAYFPVSSIPLILDGSSPIFITEGEKKSLALAQLGLAAIGIGGVYSWGKDGELIPDLALIDWKDREVFIVFDYDEKPKTRRTTATAAKGLATALKTAGAKQCRTTNLPPGLNGSKQGVDDFLVANGSDAFRSLVNQAANHTIGSMADIRNLISGIEYLVPDWIPLGMVTMVMAEPGIGKSAFVMCGLVKPLVTGTDWFDGSPGPETPGDVLFCDTENTAALTIQRISDWNIPAERIKVPFADDFLRAVDLKSDDDLAQIEAVVTRLGIKLVVIDSLRGGHGDDENSSQVARVLQRIAAIAERTNAAIVIIHHTKKLREGEGLNPNSSRGSNAIHANVKAQLGIDVPDPADGRCRLRMLKENLGVSPEPIGFRITGSGLEFTDAPCTPDSRTQKQKAIDWLTANMTPGNWHSSKELELAHLAAGLSITTVQAAKKELGIETRKIAAGWQVILPAKKPT